MNQGIDELVVFLEEMSAKVLLETGLLPQVIPDDIRVLCIPFEGKQDLEKRVLGKLRAWQNPNAAFVILRDQDSGDCKLIKRELLDKCKKAGKPYFLVRIACHELESWYLGDLQAVASGLDVKNLSKQQNNKKFRNPDALGNAKEELEKITNKKYQKIGGARAIGPYMDINKNRSHSFNIFIAGVKRLLTSL